MLDGKPIFAYVSGVVAPSRNAKTGAMAQVWIMRDDIHPLTASRTGEDASICGDCPLRGHLGKNRTCYVNISQAPVQVYKSSKTAEPAPKHIFNNRVVRLGAYGDPAALPVEIIERIVKKSALVTGYSHLWRSCDQQLKQYLMASVCSEEERILAKSMGWSTFRIKQKEDPIAPKEDTCPASEEVGKVMQCITCGRCTGDQKRDIVINVHGIGKNHFKLLQAA